MPPIELRIPSALREFAGGARSLTVRADTIDGALRRWATGQPALARRLFGTDGALRPSIALFLNERQLDAPDRGATPLHDGDRLEVVATLAGG